MPAGVPAGTLTTPVAGSMLGTGAPGLAGVAGVATASVALLTVAEAPLTESPVKALPALGLPVAPLTPLMVSLVATTGAEPTVTLIVAF